VQNSTDVKNVDDNNKKRVFYENNKKKFKNINKKTLMKNFVPKQARRKAIMFLYIQSDSIVERIGHISLIIEDYLYLFENIAGHVCFVARNRSKTPNVFFINKKVGKIKKNVKKHEIKNVKKRF